MTDHYVKVSRAHNGFILEYPSDSGEIEVVTVCEQPEHSDCEYESLIDAFWTMSEIFGGYRSKHHPHAVRITCKCKQEENDDE